MKTRSTCFSRTVRAGCLLLCVLWVPQSVQGQESQRASEQDSVIVQISPDPAMSPALKEAGPRALVGRAGAIANQAAAVAGRLGNSEPSHYEVNYQPRVWYNRVDGLHLGLDRIAETTRHFTVGGGAGWNSSLSGRDRWTWHVMAQLQSAGTTKVFVGGQYRAQTARRYGEDSYVSSLANGLVMLLGGNDYYDYYRSQGYQGTAGVKFDAIHTTLSGTFRSENHSALPLTNSYDIFGAMPLRGNPAIDEGRMQSVSADLVIGTTDSDETHGARSLSLQAEESVAGSEFNFRRYRADARWTQVTHCRECNRPGQFSLRLIAGTSNGNLPLQHAFVVDNALSIFSASGVLRSVTGPPLESSKMVAFFWEYQFGSKGFETLGFRSLSRLGSALAVFGGHTNGSWSADMSIGEGSDQTGRRLMSGSYHELGLSLLLDEIRIHFAKPLDGGRIVFRLGLVRPI